MALRWVEGFESFGSTVGTTPSATIVAQKYTTTANIANARIAAGRNGGSCFQGVAYFSFNPPVTTSANSTTIYIGFAVKVPASGNTLKVLLSMVLSNGFDRAIRLPANNYTKIQLYEGSTNLAEVDAVLSSSVWKYVEFSHTPSTGETYIKIDGQQVIYHDGTNRNATISTILIGVPAFNGTYTAFLDDLYICDSTGSVNNTFLGPCKVQCIRPSSDDANYATWTPNSGDVHYDRVNTDPSDGDTTYLEDGTSGHTDLWSFTDLSSLNSIVGLQLNTDLKLTDANAFSLYPPILSDGTQNDGSAIAGTSAYLTKIRISETDPATSTAWDLDGINAAKFGIKVV